MTQGWDGFSYRLGRRVEALGNVACVGLDPHLDRLPEALAVGPTDGTRAWRERAADRIATFCLEVVEVIAPLVPAVKPQVAFFELLGAPGVEVLEQVVRAARARGLIVVLDAKRGDIGSTARAYAEGALDPRGPLGADAVTLSPYLGPESMAPFLTWCEGEHGVFVLVRTSNTGAGIWQIDGAEPVAPRVAGWIAECNARWLDPWGFGPVGAVVAATVPEEAAEWRARMRNTWFLVPGFGAQGGTVESIRSLCREDGWGALVNSSRGVLFPSSGRGGSHWLDELRARAEAFATSVEITRLAR